MKRLVLPCLVVLAAQCERAECEFSSSSIVKESQENSVEGVADEDAFFSLIPFSSLFPSPMGMGSGVPFSFHPVLEALGMMMMMEESQTLVPEVTVNGTSCVVSVDVRKLNVTDSHTLNIKAEGRRVTVEFSDVQQPSNETVEELDVAERNTSLETETKKAFRGSRRSPISSFASVQTFEIPRQCGEADESSKATVIDGVLRLQFPVLVADEESPPVKRNGVEEDEEEDSSSEEDEEEEEEEEDEEDEKHVDEDEKPESAAATAERTKTDDVEGKENDVVEMVHQRRLDSPVAEEKPPAKKKRFTWIPVVGNDEF